MDIETKFIIAACFSLLYSLASYECGLANEDEMRNTLIKARNVLENVYSDLEVKE